MAELPEDRVDPTPAFTNCAVDFFGLFIIKQGHKELKHYGVLFMCMGSRAVYIGDRLLRKCTLQIYL